MDFGASRVKTRIEKEHQKQAIAELIEICFTFIIRCIFFCLQVDRPITKKEGKGRAYKPQFTVPVLVTWLYQQGSSFYSRT